MDVTILSEIKTLSQYQQEEFINDFENLKKHLNGLVHTILFEDESMIKDY